MNRTCSAYNQLVVHPADSDMFNLRKDGDVACPKCRSKVKPGTCGFYASAWKLEGVEASDGFFVSSPWQTASADKYQWFNADETSGLIEWEKLPDSRRRRTGRVSPRILPPHMSVLFAGLSFSQDLLPEVNAATYFTAVLSKIGPRGLKARKLWQSFLFPQHSLIDLRG